MRRAVWNEVGQLWPDAGEYGGNVQCGKSYSRRFTHTLLANRVFDVTAYPVTEDGPEGKEIRLQWQSWMVVCRDVDDPGSTEVWAETKYSDLPERFDGTYTTVENAENAARQLIKSFDPDMHIGWDGSPSIDAEES